eukprot:4625916-Pyramimonas_sp.AAC.1
MAATLGTHANDLEEIEAHPAEADAPMRASAATIFSEHGNSVEMADRAAVPPLLRTAIMKTHQSHSHGPCKESLARCLQHGGASRRSVQAARPFKCATCEGQTRAAPRRTAAQPRSKDRSDFAVAIRAGPSLRPAGRRPSWRRSRLRLDVSSGLAEG